MTDLRLQPHRRPALRRSATMTLEGENQDLPCRWSLGRTWLERSTYALPRILWIGHNPSKADAEIDDPTMLRMMDLTDRWGYQTMFVGNLIPFVSADPPTAHLLHRVYGDRVLERNVSTIREMAKGADFVLVCWGEIAKPVIDLTEIIFSQLILAGAKPMCLGTTASGAPTHPMARGRNRVPDDAVPKPWEPGP